MLYRKIFDYDIMYLCIYNSIVDIHPKCNMASNNIIIWIMGPLAYVEWR